jgi:hypothetical protein
MRAKDITKDHGTGEVQEKIAPSKGLHLLLPPDMHFLLKLSQKGVNLIDLQELLRLKKR